MGGACGGFWCVNFVGVQEVVDSEHRTFACCINGWPIGISMFSALTWLLPAWRLDLRVINGLGLVAIPFFWWIEESPRWLLQHHRMSQFRDVVTRIAATNGRRPPDLAEVIKMVEEGEKKKKTYTYHHLFRNITMTKHVLALACSWFVVSAVGYGLTFNVKNLPGNRYFNGFMMGMLGAVGNWIMPFLGKWVGRRPFHQFSLLAAGLCCGVVLAFQITSGWLDPYAEETAVTVFAILGSSSLSPAWVVIYLYSAELFPTVIRNLSNGLCSVVARVGGILAPLILILARVWTPLPFLLFTGLIAANLVLAWVALPETKDRPLPDALPPKDGLWTAKRRAPPEPL